MKKILFMTLCFLSIFLMFSTTANAAKGYQGYAVYRDGVSSIGFNYEWHAGLMDEPSTSYFLPVMHIGGKTLPNGTVLYVNWVPYAAVDDNTETFMYKTSNSFKGLYRPIENITSAKRDLVVATARNLKNQNIPFKKVAFEIPINHNSTSTYITYDKITAIRCDGVTEYSYEWNNVKMYGGDNWDISHNTNAVRTAHGALTPKIQTFSSYAVKLLDNPPTGTYK